MPDDIPTITNGRSLGTAVLVFRQMRRRALRLGDVRTANALQRSIAKLTGMDRRRSEASAAE